MTSSLAYFAIFVFIIGMFYQVNPFLLEYKFLLIASAVTALVLGIYHGKYKKQEDMNAAVNADVAHVKEAVEEEIEEIKEKLHK